MDTTTDELRTTELRREIAERRDGIGRDLEDIGDRISPARMADRTRQRTRRRFHDLRDRVMGAVEVPGSRNGGSGDHGGLRARAEEMAESVSDADPAGAVTRQVEGSPLAMGVVAFGIGFVAGSVIPPSRSEERLARRIEPGVAQLAEGVGEAAREASDSLAPAVEEEMAAVRDEATEAAGRVADQGKDDLAAAREQVT